MGLVTHAIPSLIGGISQQADPIRSDSQCETMDNMWPSIVEGLTQRYPMEMIAKAYASTLTNPFVHFIHRDISEQYAVCIINGDLKVFNTITGVEATVSFPDGKTYLNGANPRHRFSACGSADVTFIANRGVTVAMAAASGGALAGTVQTMAGLPGVPGAGAVYKVTGSTTNPFDNFYVMWDAVNAVWVEVQAPAGYDTFDAATMPHELVRTATNTFTFRKATWATRTVGDQYNAPQPKFIGKVVDAVALHRGRLVIASDEYVTFTRGGGGYYNFWRVTATTVSDLDPIHAACTHGTEIFHVRQMTSFDRALALIGDRAQAMVTAQGVLTSKTIQIDITTEFTVDPSIVPVGSGPNLYFGSLRTNGTSIYEYFVEKDTVTNDAAEITAHCPTYIPPNVHKLIPSATNDVLLVHSDDTPNILYVYKYHWSGNDKLQSAWCRWILDSGDTLIGADFVGSNLHLLIQRSDGIFLEKMLMSTARTDAGMGMLVHLDRRQELTGSYDAGNDWTTWTLGYNDDGDIQVVLGASFTGKIGSLLTTTRPTSGTIRATGNWSTGTCFVGRAYSKTWTPSELYLRDKDNVAVLDGRLQLKQMTVSFKDSGYFAAVVTPKARSAYTYEWTGKTLGSPALVIGSPTLDSGTFSFPIMARNLGVTISITSSSYLPLKLSAASWTGLYVPRADRV